MLSTTNKSSVIVTGGASGIGYGIAQYLATQPNSHVSILDIDATAGGQAVRSLQTSFPATSFSFHECNVASWESQLSAFEAVYTQQGRVDLVFANAGVTEKGKLVPTEKEIQDGRPSKPDLTTLNVNLSGVIYSVKLALHYLSRNEPRHVEGKPASKGSIICTASNAGIYPFPMAPLYASSKHGIVGLVRSLARPLLKEQIQINALAPAVIQTNIAESADLFQHMVITPMSTATKAVEIFIQDPNLSGIVAEIHGDHVTFAKEPDFVDADTKANIEMFWTLGYA